MAEGPIRRLTSLLKKKKRKKSQGARMERLVDSAIPLSL
jgi:hypothetical protein